MGFVFVISQKVRGSRGSLLMARKTAVRELIIFLVLLFVVTPLAIAWYLVPVFIVPPAFLLFSCIMRIPNLKHLRHSGMRGAHGLMTFEVLCLINATLVVISTVMLLLAWNESWAAMLGLTMMAFGFFSFVHYILLIVWLTKRMHRTPSQPSLPVRQPPFPVRQPPPRSPSSSSPPLPRASSDSGSTQEVLVLAHMEIIVKSSTQLITAVLPGENPLPGAIPLT
eukprot:gnl/Chilomastix_cuspidata/2798.p2 GENE.gnl/Chilomastix_cuspidata/2798~~gnl/Chilomastix_cuspidata/2798.p2  ORF type:complete len:224 (-),score=66.25 gnl/Chilomastix_cuspidata/2798:316-987(-)